MKNIKIVKTKKIKLGANQRKILLLLKAGLVLGFCRSPLGYIKIAKHAAKEWREIKKRSLQQAIDSLYESKLISEEQNEDGSTTMVLTDQGKEKIIRFDLDKIELKKPVSWDKRWRLVIFDIPEHRKGERDALRQTLKRVGFRELQKSVLIYPHECRDELDYVIEFFDLRRHVRLITATGVDNELHLKHIFKIIP